MGMNDMNVPYESLEQLIPVHLKDNPAPYYIANILREAIYRGILPEGESLHQSQLADRLKVSPIPLREALRLLEMEGLVDFRGRRGAMVTGLSVDEVREIYEMITALEVLVLRIAFPNITPSILKSAEEVLDVMEVERDCILWREKNLMFHTFLYEAADRPLTMDQLSILRQQVDRYIRIHLNTIRDESQKQHRELLEAVRAGDIDAAVTSLTRHLECTSKKLQACLSRARETKNG